MTATLAGPAPSGLRDTLRVRATLRGRRGITALTLAALGYYLFHAITEQQSYLTTGYDLGIFDQAVRAYAHFRAPTVPLKGPGYDILGDHFHPIIAVLAPLYWVWDDPLVLVIAQAVLMAASVPVVYRFTRRRTGYGLSLVVAGAYAFGWPMQALIDFDFHEIAFATPLLALAVDALDRRRYRPLVVWSVLLLFVREDMGAVVLVLALLWWWQRRRPIRPALALAAAGVGAYLLTTIVIIPHFAGGSGFAYGGQYDALGNSPSSAVVHLATHPWDALRLLVSPNAKLATLAYLFLPVALLSLRSRYVLLVVPMIAERFFNSRHNLWQPHFHYNALPWLVLVLAMVDGADRLGLFRSAAARARWGRAALGAWLVAFPVLLIWGVLPIRPAPTPVTSMRDRAHIGATAHVRAAEAVVAYLPRDVCVEAANQLVPHLTPRNYVAVPHLGASNADFIVLDLAAPDVGGNDGPKPAPVFAAAQAHGYTVVFRAGTMVVLRSPTYAGPSAACGPLGAGKS